MTVVAKLIGLCFSLPIWFYLQYKILSMVGASELMWFLFWIYIPATIFGALLSQLGGK